VWELHGKIKVSIWQKRQLLNVKTGSCMPFIHIFNDRSGHWDIQSS